jgi:hypothetical protein
MSFIFGEAGRSAKSLFSQVVIHNGRFMLKNVIIHFMINYFRLLAVCLVFGNLSALGQNQDKSQLWDFMTKSLSNIDSFYLYSRLNEVYTIDQSEIPLTEEHISAFKNPTTVYGQELNIIIRDERKLPGDIQDLRLYLEGNNIFWRLRFLLQGKSILYAVINGKVHAKDTLGLRQYNDRHRTLFGLNPQYLDPIDSLDLLKYNTIGFSCGLVPSSTSLVESMYKLACNKDITALLDWCKSTSPEKRGCGAYGLKLIERQGVPLASDVLAIMQDRLEEDISLDYCSGCSGGPLPRENAKSLLESKERFGLLEAPCK